MPGICTNMVYNKTDLVWKLSKEFGRKSIYSQTCI